MVLGNARQGHDACQLISCLITVLYAVIVPGPGGIFAQQQWTAMKYTDDESNNQTLSSEL